MFINSAEDPFNGRDEIFELNTDEQSHVAGGPEQPNDPGH